jgi:hypothetical protein
VLSCSEYTNLYWCYHYGGVSESLGLASIRLGSCSTTVCTRRRSSYILRWHIVLHETAFRLPLPYSHHRLAAGRTEARVGRRGIDKRTTYHVPRETSMNVPTAQLLAANGSIQTCPPISTSAKLPVRCGAKISVKRTRTDAEPTDDADADTTRNSAQQAVPRTRDFSNPLQVVIW